MRIRTAVLLSLISLTACKKKTGYTGQPEPVTYAPTPRAAEDIRPTAAAAGPAEAEAPEAEKPRGQPLSELTVGATFEVDDGITARVMNQEPVADEFWRYPPGSPCTSANGAKVTIVGRDGDETLVRYRRLPMRVRTHAETDPPEADDERVSLECPDGTLFFITSGKDLGLRSDTDAQLEKARKLLAPAPAAKPEKPQH